MPDRSFVEYRLGVLVSLRRPLAPPCLGLATENLPPKQACRFPVLRRGMTVARMKAASVAKESLRQVRPCLDREIRPGGKCSGFQLTTTWPSELPGRICAGVRHFLGVLSRPHDFSPLCAGLPLFFFSLDRPPERATAVCLAKRSSSRLPPEQRASGFGNRWATPLRAVR
jgi:hypothetical protein